MLDAIIKGSNDMLSTGLSNLWAQKHNREEQDYNWRVYERTKKDEYEQWLRQNEYDERIWSKQNEYNEMLWHKMNDYNSPMSQMARFKEAGLNPFLVYGKDNSAPAIANASFGSSSVKGSGHALSYKPRYSDINLGLDSFISAIYDIKEQSARTNNLVAQGELLDEEKKLKAADVAGKSISNAKAAIDLDVSSELKQTSIDAAKTSLDKVKTDLQILKSTADPTIKRARAELDRILSETDVNRRRSQLLQWEYDLRSTGGNPNDPAWQRYIREWWENSSKDVKNTINLYKFFKH